MTLGAADIQARRHHGNAQRSIGQIGDPGFSAN
jgi:hypothetical protein